MGQYRINKYLTLRLEDNKTIIYVNKIKFEQCKYLLLINPSEEAGLENFDSIDELSKNLNSNLENTITIEELGISVEEEFRAHCSNLQAWFENNYDSRLLHSNLSFPLLKKLAEMGDKIALAVFKEEIMRRLESGYLAVIEFLITERYIDFLDKEDLYYSLLNPREAEAILSIDNALTNNYLRPLISIENEGPYGNFFIFKDKKVITLHLEYMKTHKFPLDIVEKISALSSLQVLELHSTKVEGIPDSFIQLLQLKKLVLREIFIGGEFPKVITRIPSLEIIDLSRNYISSIPIEIENLNCLKNLNLELNQLETIPKSLGNLLSLEVLNLNHNKIKKIPQSIGGLRNIKNLDLGNNKLRELPSSIANLISIEDLDLQGNILAALPININLLKSLNTLFLNDNKDLDNFILQHLCNMATLMKNLRNLYLDEKQMEIIPCDLRFQSDKRKKIIKLIR